MMGVVHGVELVVEGDGVGRHEYELSMEVKVGFDEGNVQEQ